MKQKQQPYTNNISKLIKILSQTEKLLLCCWFRCVLIWFNDSIQFNCSCLLFTYLIFQSHATEILVYGCSGSFVGWFFSRFFFLSINSTISIYIRASLIPICFTSSHFSRVTETLQIATMFLRWRAKTLTRKENNK